jgi:dethiobiotin synthetase
MLNVFISGLERQSGKTLVCAGISATMQSLSYSTSVYKPIQTGAEVVDRQKFSPDLAFIRTIDSNILTKSSFLMSDTSIPMVSAYKAKVNINVPEIINTFQSISNITECNIVEGCNSISTLIAEGVTEADIVKDLKLPLILVINPTISTIDNVISGINYINSKKIPLHGVVITQYNENSDKLEHKYFPQILKDILGLNILGILPDYVNLETLPAEILIADILTKFNLEEIFKVKIAKLTN